MGSTPHKHEAKLVDRLASTTNRLRNLFYVNLLLAAAIFYLVYQDHGFVSEKVGPALKTLSPILKVDQHIKQRLEGFERYRQELSDFLTMHQQVSLGFQQAGEAIEDLTQPERDQIEAAFTANFNGDQGDYIEWLIDSNDAAELRAIMTSGLANYFARDLSALDYPHVAGFAAYLYPDYWLPLVEKARDLLKQTTSYLPVTVPQLEQLESFDPQTLDLERYNEDVLRDSALEVLLDSLPEANDLFEAFMIVETYCTANGLGYCSIADIEALQAKQGDGAPGKLAAAGIEVNVTRELVIPAAPFILLIAQHLFMMQFRRRQILREELSQGMTRFELDLLDESWILGSLVLNATNVKSLWRRFQSGLMLLFLIMGEIAPLLAVGMAAYHIFNQIVLGGVIAQEFADAMTELKQFRESLGIDAFIFIPDAPSLLWEYLWLGAAGLAALILSITLAQLFRDQYQEVFAQPAK